MVSLHFSRQGGHEQHLLAGDEGVKSLLPRPLHQLGHLAALALQLLGHRQKHPHDGVVAKQHLAPQKRRNRGLAPLLQALQRCMATGVEARIGVESADVLHRI